MTAGLISAENSMPKKYLVLWRVDVTLELVIQLMKYIYEVLNTAESGIINYSDRCMDFAQDT
jgi:hypothetical protein